MVNDEKAKQYNLVHVTAGGEYKAPLVASQLFDQAELQATTKEGFAPLRTSAWIIGSFNEYRDAKSKQKIAELKSRCPNTNIKMLNGVGRLGNFPLMPMMRMQRSRLDRKVPVIYHCR